MTWCVVHTQPLKETIAEHHLKAQGYEVYFPRFKKLRRHARKTEEVLSPLFPRYLFVNMDLEKTPWRSVNSTRGVSYLLMTDELHPARIESCIINALKFQEVSPDILPAQSLITFAKGDKVRILEGVFKDYVATFESFDDKERVQILLTFLGREASVALPSYAVEQA